MKLGIMQPYFFPYIGYISLIKNTDEFILFDTVQFIKHGWIERNRILKPGGEWQYIAVPLVKHSIDTKIMDIKIRNNEDWKNKIISQLSDYKKRAPYYNETMEVVREALNIETDNITILNKHILEVVCKYLGFNPIIKIFSEMDLQIEEATAPDEWALNICKALGNVDEYWNPPGGIEFFDKSKYDKAGIKLLFQSVNIVPYVQRIGYFEPGLSIIDVMMFNTKEEINAMLDNYEFINVKKRIKQ